jgi:hypothetical protein
LLPILEGATSDHAKRIRYLAKDSCSGCLQARGNLTRAIMGFVYDDAPIHDKEHSPRRATAHYFTVTFYTCSHRKHGDVHARRLASGRRQSKCFWPASFAHYTPHELTLPGEGRILPECLEKLRESGRS